jgi:2-polyprenyl-6-methoxyphenol hydroxylase-like FAD-dependent oxidoreductase
MSEIEVLVIGGGPTGLTLALELIAQKVSFRIIDKATERSPYSRSLVVQPRSQELLNRYTGNVHELLATGFQAAGTTIAVNGKKVADMDSDFIGITPTNFPAPRAISQADTERFLEKLVNERGVSVEMGVEAKSIEADADGVTVRLAARDGAEETVRVKYVIGADGAHSSVRHAAKSLTFEGDAYPQEFMLADLRLKADVPLNRAYMCLGRGVMAVLPMKDDMVRLVVSRQGHGGTSVPKLADFESFTKQVFPGHAQLTEPFWMTRFNLHHRGVNCYREGRLLLAGDAAHIHSPAGGQGMNTGIQDAVNLGWKIGAVLRGEQPDSFLDSYDAERRPIGKYLLRTSDKTFSTVASTNPIFVFFRNLILPWILPWVVSSPKRVLNSLKFMTQLGIRYRRSPIVNTASGFKGPIRGGDRAVEGTLKGPEGERYLQQLFTPESHHLVLFSGIESQAASEGELSRAETKFLESSRTPTKVHTIFADSDKAQPGYVDVNNTIHKNYGFKGAGYVLVRPDMYVAHIGPLSALDNLIKSS